MSNNTETTARVTKRSQAEAIYDSMTKTARGKVRARQPAPAEVKARFVAEINMTTAQAATYYHMINSGKWER
jgi:hypothetical protein